MYNLRNKESWVKSIRLVGSVSVTKDNNGPFSEARRFDVASAS